LSQHETLIRLSSVKGASVYYACPMLFDIADIWKQPDINNIRFVDIRTSPDGWATNQRHFITFQNETDPVPLWQSEPIEGKSVDAQGWISRNSNFSPKKMTGSELLELIENSIQVISHKEGEILLRGQDMYTRVMPGAFTILKFGIID
ncbi:MAG: hypothetical protein NT022_02815, partial [Deltaproteobacteria bacterium]|nr:hypothetical protein [Deltaproteobacteria bacterium]